MSTHVFLKKEVKNKMRKDFVKLYQDGFVMYLISLSIDELIENTRVEYYDPNNNTNGYQRPLIPSHYRKISQYLQNSKNPILPTAILTAVDPGQVTPENEQVLINGKLRVVDGQHRIAGFRHLRSIDEKAFSKVRNYSISTIIMEISQENKIYEIESFININKTSKPVSTDLAIQLREKIRRNNIKRLEEEMNLSIATNICNNLNSNGQSIWYQHIKLGDDNNKGKTISISAFLNSILCVVDNYLELNADIENFNQYERTINILTEFIEDAWKKIKEKWPICFKNENESGNIRYNIQKGIGVYPLHEILGESLKLANGNLDEGIDNFNKILIDSKVEQYNWMVGGDFSSYNSKAGFKTIIEYINNKRTFIEEDK